MSLGGWLLEQLFERRIVVVTGRLDDEAATKAAAALLALDARGDRPIELHLDSSDGALTAAFALIDTADALRSALRILCRGQLGGIKWLLPHRPPPPRYSADNRPVKESSGGPLRLTKANCNSRQIGVR